MSYFHAVWREDKSTKLGVDYTVLPQLSGRGRFLGVSLGIFANKAYETTWWGEGEIKFYIDGDKEFPTLSGTGVEDYIGTAWGRVFPPLSRLSDCKCGQLLVEYVSFPRAGPDLFSS